MSNKLLSSNLEAWALADANNLVSVMLSDLHFLLARSVTTDVMLPEIDMPLRCMYEGLSENMFFCLPTY